MNIEEARLYLEHTSKDDFNLEEWQNENRYQAIQVVLEEIERLTAESTKWESKFYDEAKKVDKAIEYIEENKRTYENDEYCFDDMIDDVVPLLDILKGVDKE